MDQRMSNVDIMQQGLDLAVYGMGTVFLFLTLLVLATMAMSSLLNRNASVEPVEAASGEPDPQTRAAIGAAIRKYRDDHRT